MRELVRIVVVMLAASVALAGCSRKEAQRAKAPVPEKTADVGVASEVEPSPPHVVITFNTGLARNYIAFVEERLAGIIRALKETEADVICLQEVWDDADAEAIVAGVKQPYPHSFRVATGGETDESAPACTGEALRPLGECVTANCADAADTTGCVMSKCGVLFLGLHGGCRACLAAHVSQPLEEILVTCTRAGAGKWSYRGRNGLLLLSNTPFLETSHEVLDSFLLRRAVLMGTVKLRGGPVPFFCTHLSTPVDEVEYAGTAGSWKEEQANQTERLVMLVKSKAGKHPAVLLGDFNCGPGNDEWEVVAENPDNFSKLLKAGFASPYTEDHGHCTWCYGKDLSRTDKMKGKMLDHILFVNFDDEIITVERAMDEARIEVNEADSARKVPLSDHYAVQAEFSVPFVQ